MQATFCSPFPLTRDLKINTLLGSWGFLLQALCGRLAPSCGGLQSCTKHRVPTHFPQSNSSMFKVHFKPFQHLTAVANYICLYSTYFIYSILIISLLHHIKTGVIVQETTTDRFRDSMLQKGDKIMENTSKLV